jgi:asparagine synthase (glutamine-hydrolysing)
MSGIFGIVDFGGAPVDDALLRDLTEQMAFRGPDRREIRHEGAVGFGHALLAINPQSENEHQPLNLSDEVWLVADARIDDQRTLIDALRSRRIYVASGARDAELILAAYDAWGIECVDHLMGDFAFAIWDRRYRRLMLARDHFGVVPMYHARLGDRIIFGNTLEVVRKYPGLGGELNDIAVADYLLFGHSIDLENTFFTQVRSVPPASRIVWNDSAEARSERYWSLPEPDRYHRIESAREFTAEFRTILTTATRDRMRASRIALSLSGGLDSGAIAMIAASLSRDEASSTSLHAYSFGHDWMVPETERHYASLTARAADIETTYISVEQCMYDGTSLWRALPEPRMTAARRNANNEILRQIAVAGERVHLTGMAGDVLMGASALDWRKFWQSGSVPASMGMLANYCIEQRWMPLSRIVDTVRPAGRRTFSATSFPWLAAEFVSRVDLRARVDRMSTIASKWKTAQHRMAYDPLWTSVLSLGDPEFTRIAAKSWHPFYDRRVIEFAMRTPPLPWFIDKLALREAMRGILPEAVRRRRKVSPTRGAARYLPTRRLYAEADEIARVPELSRYVDQERLLKRVAGLAHPKPVSPASPSDGLHELELPLCLGFWLKSTPR